MSSSSPAGTCSAPAFGVGSAAGSSRSWISRSSVNWAARVSRSPAAVTIIESPSKTNSSWPPIRFTYATVAPASAARRLTSGSRTSSLFSSYGEALIVTTRPTPARRAAANGPPACHRSSHTVSAMSTPPNRTTVSSAPGSK
jgi:hypothetical protein